MSTIQRTELRLMRWLRKREFNLVTLFFHTCTELGSSKGWTLFSLCIIFGFDFSFGWAIGLSSLFGAFCAQIIKRQIKRKRPCLHPNAPPALAHVPDPWSFPSGHTATAFSVAGMLWCIGHVWCWPFTHRWVFSNLSGCSLPKRCVRRGDTGYSLWLYLWNPLVAINSAPVRDLVFCVRFVRAIADEQSKKRQKGHSPV